MESSSNSNNWTRRKFLSTCTTGVGGLALAPFVSACAQMDRIIVGDATTERKRVMILGAGLSGLVAARELKRNGIPFRLYEASNRVGGRVMSLQTFNAADQVVDMGAEWFNEDDDFVLNLCHDFKIDTQEVPLNLREPHGFLNSSLEKEIRSFEQKTRDFKAATSDQKLDQMSVAELWDKIGTGVSPQIRKLAEAINLSQFGQPSEKISSLYFLDRRNQDLTGWNYWRGRKWRVVGGAQVITDALYDKISGVVPDQIVVRNYRATEIADKNGHFQVTFATPNGEVSIEADVLICTLPMSVLREISGIETLGLPADKMTAIRNLRYGTHGKIAASYTDRFWTGNGGSWLTESLGWLWDMTPITQNFVPMRRGVLAAQFGGAHGAELGPLSFDVFKNEVGKINPKKTIDPEYWQLMNWNLHPFSRGSVAYLAPGQVHSFSGSLSRAERKGRMIFAGEHTSYSSMGTMNGAIESGLRAAIEASHFKSELSKIIAL